VGTQGRVVVPSEGIPLTPALHMKRNLGPQRKKKKEAKKGYARDKNGKYHRKELGGKEKKKEAKKRANPEEAKRGR